MGVNVASRLRFVIDLGAQTVTSPILQSTMKLEWMYPKNKPETELEHGAQESPKVFSTQTGEDSEQ